MRFSIYELYRKEEELDKYGVALNKWKKVDDIEVCINVKTISEVKGEVLYKVENIIGLTKYSYLDNEHTYKLVKDGIEYKVNTIMFGRFNQMNLVKVTN